MQDELTQALIEGFFEELAEVGYGKLSLEAVARRAGAGKAAIYRRWSSKREMTVALASQVAVSTIGAPDTGTLRGDLTAFLDEALSALRHPLAFRIIPDLLAEAARDEALADALKTAVRAPRRENAARMLRRAVERGELPADVDIELALDFLVAPLYWRLFVTQLPASADYLERLVTTLIHMLER
ncbi:TetR-like C-terminal domain-containing protein [Dactylosporangium sp. NPDC005572]|uniref:TetR-like C-terminal domain-containing protein n=1 Tax=Dactylosporangium sp. NPDC005572 TaxID=3156889 RepID=UPI0033B9942F